jgi:hypothetical protein
MDWLALEDCAASLQAEDDLLEFVEGHWLLEVVCAQTFRTAAMDKIAAAIKMGH